MKLAGKQVVVTRPKTQSEVLIRLLQAQGAKVILMPTIQIAPLADYHTMDRALADLASYDWLILTSGNTVDAVVARLAVLGIGIPPSTQVAAIGSKTAAKLQSAGFRVNFVPEAYLSDALVLGLGDLFNHRVLLPVTDIAPPTLPQAIRQAGGEVDVVTAYHTRTGEVSASAISAIKQGVDVLTFTSGSTVRNFFALLKQQGLDPLHLPGKPLVACIGPKTAQEALLLGLTVHVVATIHTVEGLVTEIQNYDQDWTQDERKD